LASKFAVCPLCRRRSCSLNTVILCLLNTIDLTNTSIPRQILFCSSHHQSSLPTLQNYFLFIKRSSLLYTIYCILLMLTTHSLMKITCRLHLQWEVLKFVICRPPSSRSLNTPFWRCFHSIISLFSR
jgi:hypothetical protein